MRRRTLVIGSVVLVGAALVLFCCASGERRGAEEPTSSTEPSARGDSDGVVAPGGTATDGAARGETATDGAAPSGTATDAGAPTWAHDAGAADTAGPTDGGTSPTPGAGARIVQALQTSDPRDLKLLSSIERELHRDPPAEIHALVKLRKSGAGRAELGRAIGALSELPLRVMALRWLDEVAPAGDGGAR